MAAAEAEEVMSATARVSVHLPQPRRGAAEWGQLRRPQQQGTLLETEAATHLLHRLQLQQRRLRQSIISTLSIAAHLDVKKNSAQPPETEMETAAASRLDQEVLSSD